MDCLFSLEVLITENFLHILPGVKQFHIPLAKKYSFSVNVLAIGVMKNFVITVIFYIDLNL